MTVPSRVGAGRHLVDSKGLGLRASYPLMTMRSTLSLKLGHLIVSTRGDLSRAVDGVLRAISCVLGLSDKASSYLPAVDGVAQILEAPLPHITRQCMILGFVKPLSPRKMT